MPGPDRPSSGKGPFGKGPQKGSFSKRPTGTGGGAPRVGRSFAKRFSREGGPAPRSGDDDRVVLYGWHPVFEALSNPRRTPLRLLATENGVRRLTEALGTLPIEPELVRPDAIVALLTPDSVHQGLYLEATPLPAPALDAIPADAVILVLDQITDPHNVGAIVRSAAAFGVTAIVTTARHSPAATGVMAKSASGGLEHVPFIHVRNLGDALEDLSRQGVTCIGLDSDGDVALDTLELPRPLALVLGAEGKGLRARTKELCGAVARLDLPGAIRSLNVSNAAAISLYVAMGRARASKAE